MNETVRDHCKKAGVPFTRCRPYCKRFEAEPWRTSRELFERLQGEQPGVFPDGQLRTLQRRIKGWRREMAHMMVFGSAGSDETIGTDAATGARL